MSCQGSKLSRKLSDQSTQLMGFLFYFVFEGNFQVQASPPGGLISRGRFNGGFFALRVWGFIFGGAYLRNFTVCLITVISLIATTSRKRPPRVSDRFTNNPFFFSVKNCFKNSLVSDHYLNFQSDSDHFLGQKFDIFFCFLFPISDQQAWSRTIVRKPSLECHKS